MAVLKNSDALYSASKAHGHIDILIDPMAHEDWEQLDAATLLDPANISPLHDKIFAENKSLAPTLLRVPHGRFESVEAWLEISQDEARSSLPTPRLVCAFISVDTPLHRLNSDLSQPLTAQVDRQALYFRYFDPRVFHHLSRLLTSEQWAFLLPASLQWRHVCWNGQLVTNQSAEAARIKSHGLLFDAQQWASIESIEHFNATLCAFRRHGLGHPTREDAVLFGRVVSARQAGLKTPEDVAHYILVSTMMAQELSTQLPWDQLLAALSNGAKLAELVPV
jgi:hypothetical protein